MIFPLIVLLSLNPLGASQDATFEAPDLNFETMDGVTVSLFAESPMLFNPTAMDVDDQGRVWVCEGVNYRQWRGKNPGRHHDGGDRIMVLQDTTGDGVADSSTVFVQDEDLTAPLGIAVIGNAVYVSCSPNLFIYRDLDGDLKADEREVFLTGFGGFDHDHGLHSVVEHPSGDLLWCAGNAGPHLVEDKAGFNLRSGSMYNGGGPAPAGNNPGLISDDGRVWTGGVIGRIGKNGKGMRVLAHNFRNQYEVAVDSFGLMYTFDNDDDGNQGCRALCLTPGADYGYFGSDGTRTWQADKRAGLETFTAHWHQGDPGVMPAGTQTGAGGPCGVTVYEHEAIPALAGHVLAADAGRSLVFDFKPEIEGAQVKLTESILIRPALGADGKRGHWFRPSDVVTGPDGSIYVADWFDPGVGGHAAGDRKAYGRILRLSPDSRTDQEDGERQIEATLDARMAEMAAIEHRRNLDLVANVWSAVADPAFPTKASIALNGRLHSAWRHKDARVRLAALEACLSSGMPPQDVIQHFTKDSSALVRARAAAHLELVPWSDSKALLIDLALQYDGQDRTYLESIGIGARHKETELYLELVQRLDPTQDRALVRDFAWRLHPTEAFALLQSEASQQGAELSIRRKALDAIAFMPERQAAEFMVSQALAGANDIREYAATWVRNRSTNLWSEYGLVGSLGGEFESAQVLWRSDLLTASSASATVDIRDVSTLWLVVEDGGNGMGYDWAAWLAPSIQTASGSIDLKNMAWTRAKAGWGAPRWGKNCEGGP
ncbi:MAG: NPCBM/NEW2 domain-containing protein, partial [Planctomycetes bacterium]|nr:NPCBM/NEW2 domain-containing protein [Planctomycetota bacterium]